MRLFLYLPATNNQQPGDAKQGALKRNAELFIQKCMPTVYTKRRQDTVGAYIWASLY